jgi:hypothetical protein
LIPIKPEEVARNGKLRRRRLIFSPSCAGGCVESCLSIGGPARERGLLSVAKPDRDSSGSLNAFAEASKRQAVPRLVEKHQEARGLGVELALEGSHAETRCRCEPVDRRRPAPQHGLDQDSRISAEAAVTLQVSDLAGRDGAMLRCRLKWKSEIADPGQDDQDGRLVVGSLKSVAKPRLHAAPGCEVVWCAKPYSGCGVRTTFSKVGDHAERLDQRRKALLDNVTRLTATSVTTVSSKRDGAIKPRDP